MKRVHLIVHGRVQGVLFRHYTHKKAVSLGLKGFVRNLADGSVEVVAEGEDANIDELIKFCRKGPVFAKVTDIEVKIEKVKGEFDGFEVRY